MFQLVKQRMKNEKGLTLIELLAVVVILGIIAAIAIPAIGGLIDNSKKDAHVANAQQMISSAKTYVAGNANEPLPTGGKLTLAAMQTQGLIDEMEDPDDKGYVAADSFVLITKNENKYTYKVTLTNGDSKRAINNKTQDQLKRSAVGAAANETP